jgi:hypothetical protein
MTIFVLKNGNRLGPFTLEQVAASIQKREMLMTDLAWHEGMAEWRPLHELAGIIETVLPRAPEIVDITKPKIDTNSKSVQSVTAKTLEIVQSNPQKAGQRSREHKIVFLVAFIVFWAGISVIVGCTEGFSIESQVICLLVSLFLTGVLVVGVLLDEAKTDSRQKIAGVVRVVLGFGLITFGIWWTFLVWNWTDAKKFWPSFLGLFGIRLLWDGIKQLRGQSLKN